MNRLLQFIRVILKWRKFIFYNTLVVTFLGIVISFVLPQRYTAVARLLPPQEEDLFGTTSLLTGGLSSGRLSRLRLGGMLGGATSSDLMVGILASRTIMQNVVERCSIVDYYRIKRRSMEAAIKTLRKLTTLSVSDEGIVTIRVEAKTPQLAANIANSFVEELDVFLRTSNISRGRNMRLFLERHLAEVESTFRLAQESLRVFQQRYKTVTVDEESKAAIEAYAKLKSELYIKQAELGMIEGVSNSSNPYIRSLKAEVSSFEDQLRRLEQGGDRTGFGVGFGVPFESLPDVGAEYVRRYRDVKVQEEAFAMLYQQYEYAKVLEARDTPTLTVLDYAVPPERRSFPRRLPIALIVFFFGLTSGACFAFVSEYFEHLQKFKPDEYQGWREAAGQLVGGLRHIGRLFLRKRTQE